MRTIFPGWNIHRKVSFTKKFTSNSFGLLLKTLMKYLRIESLDRNKLRILG